MIVVGYEMLEINLIAIAKLRTNLRKFDVAMDCIIDLKYGKFRNDDFIEDEEGEDPERAEKAELLGKNGRQSSVVIGMGNQTYNS